MSPSASLGRIELVYYCLHCNNIDKDYHVGMAVTLQQSRLLGERFAGGMTDERILRDATTMRLLGTRRTVCEKNVS